MNYKFRSFVFVHAVFVCIALLCVPISAKDEWIEIRSKNFYLIGNASEKDVRKAATKLEQFRETFRLVFKGMSLSSPIPTNVVVFKSNSAYKPFKPKRADGKADNFIAGYFQPGEDVNYITLSTDGPDENTYGTIFHEYVHFLLDTNFGKSDVPTWFNEGLAEYYQTYVIEQDQTVKLGLPQSGHLELLQQSKMLPLSTLFGTSNRTLHQNGGHSRSIFYAQSWALVHYLIQDGKSDGLGKFLASLIKDVPPEKAFQDAFQIGYAEMEKELRKYVGRATYRYQSITFKNKLVFDTEMIVRPLSVADSNAFLGDLLYHTQSWDDAEPYLRNSIAAQPDHELANTTLGMVKMRQRKFDEAKTFLEKAVAANQKNHLALYRYAYLLSRDGQDDMGWVSGFKPEKAAKMRDLLKKAIAANPQFTESYELLAFVSLVTGENQDEAIELLKTALKYQPGNQRYALRIAELLAQQRKFADAGTIAEKISSTADDEEVKSRAESLTAQIKRSQESFARYEEDRKKYEEAMKERGDVQGPPVLIRNSGDAPMPAGERKAREEAMLRGLNLSIRKPGEGETQAIGSIQKVDCVNGRVLFAVKTEAESFILGSKDFVNLEIGSYMVKPVNEFGCNTQVGHLKAVIIYRPVADVKATTKGDLISIDFVPDNFRFIDDAEQPADAVVIETGGGGSATEAPDAQPDDLDAARRKMMMEAIKQNLRKPGNGEQRILGFIERSECNGKGIFFQIKTGAQPLRLSADPNRQPEVRGFSRDIEGLQIGCGMKAVEVPVVVTYAPTVDSKSKVAGQIVSLEFVPKGFQLN